MIFWFYLQLLKIVNTQQKITNSVSMYNLGDNSTPAKYMSTFLILFTMGCLLLKGCPDSALNHQNCLKATFEFDLSSKRLLFLS